MCDKYGWIKKNKILENEFFIYFSIKFLIKKNKQRISVQK